AQPAGQAARGREARGEPVLGFEGEVADPRAELRATDDDPVDRPAHGEQAVRDLNVRAGALGDDAVGEYAGGKVVALADRGGEEQDARGAQLPGARRR